jgi:hypothetical protein
MKIETVKAFKNFVEAQFYSEEEAGTRDQYAKGDHPDMLYVALDKKYGGAANVEMLFTKHFGISEYKPFALRFEGEIVQTCIPDVMQWISIKTGERFTNKRNGNLNKKGERFAEDLRCAVLTKLGTGLWLGTSGIVDDDVETEKYVIRDLATMNTIVSQTGWGFNPNYKG